MKSVRDCDRVDLRVFWVDVATSSGTGFGKLTRVTSGVNLPPLEVIMSRCKDLGHYFAWPKEANTVLETKNSIGVYPLPILNATPGRSLRRSYRRGRHATDRAMPERHKTGESAMLSTPLCLTRTLCFILCPGQRAKSRRKRYVYERNLPHKEARWLKTSPS
jgi:hypothetical protein